SNPVLNDTILSISISSNNTDDSDVRRLKLWVDNGASGFQGLGTDTLIGNSYFVSGTAVFDTDIFENSGLRLFVTYDIDTVVTDNNILDAYINSGGLVLQNAGSLPVSGTINSAGNSSVNVSAVKLVLSSGTSVSSVGDTAALNITASDIYGNRDKNYNSTILSLTNNASAKYVSSTLNSASGIPNGPVTGFLNEGQGIVVCRDSISETVVFTAASSGLASGTQVYYWYNLAGINISMQNYYDTVSQIISVSGTLTNGASGDSVELYVNSALQSSASVNLNQWTGTVSLSGYNDTVSACLIRQSSVIAADTRIINYFGSLSIEITYPNTSSFDTSVNNFEIRGSVLNAGSGDTVNIFVNSVFQSNNVITVLNGNFSGTASISGYYDSITVQIIDKFGRNAFDTITAGYYQAPDVKITFPDSQVYDTCSIEVTISGTAININFGDTVEIFSDTVLNSVISITSLNQQWTGTARLHYPGDSVIIKLSTKFGYTDYDTVSIRLYYPNRLYGFVLLQGRTDNSGCSAVFRSISDTYCAVSDSTGYLILQNIIPGTYNLQLYASAYKIETYNNIVIDTDTVVNSGTLQLSGGDLDMSGNITLDDLSILFYYFGKQVDSPLKGDINNSGWVTEDDYSIIIHNLKE
ncbi:hypothetical protein KA977_11800, partial [Candidatus Dependentiae bacterium]|nr:hypothetical protein [Candidatus Dependentiae bacterium]